MNTNAGSRESALVFMSFMEKLYGEGYIKENK